MRKGLVALVVMVLLVAALWSSSGTETEVLPPVPQPAVELKLQADHPNIVVIIADDLGYTDLGSYGSEIETPNLDALANAGTRLSQFHVGAACSPTRAMLLTGVDNHQVGMGAFNQETIASNQEGQPGYEGYLTKRTASLGELFLNAGYNTYLSGKWHLGEGPVHSPAAHGFKRSFVLLEGGAGHFNALPVKPFRRQAGFRENGALVDLPDSFYSSDFYADKLVSYIEQDISSQRPFLGILAFTAPHWPIQAKPETIKKYQGRYDAGYDQLAESRRQALVDLGLLVRDVAPRPYAQNKYSRWDSLSKEEQRFEAKRMAVYAAMIDDMDQAVGRVVDRLKALKKYDNTLFVFLSDNGAEGHDMSFLIPYIEFSTLFGVKCCDNSYENMGNASSFIDQGAAWAAASVGPHRIYKGFPTQGGIVAPAFFSGLGVQENEIFKDFASVKDVLPTLLDVAGIPKTDKQFLGREVLPMEGKSMLPMLTGQSDSVHGNDIAMGWEFFSKQAVRVGDWKLIRMPEPYGENKWELFNLAQDPSESEDLAAREPDELKKMLVHWERYREESNVIVPDSMPVAY